MDIHPNFSLAYHPPDRWTTERVNKIPDVMLRAGALQYGRSWNNSLSYAEFSDNNNYEESLKMAPFEMPYGRRCRTSLFWNKAGGLKVLDPTYCKKVKDKYIC
jgi:hypothetical protein